jgi:putative RecB family exonuclease
MGKIVHEALEWLYDTLVNHDLASKKEVIAYYHQKWNSGWNNEIRIVKQEFNSEHYQNLGEECLDMYYERYKPFDQAPILGLEKRVYIDLPEGKKMMGIIDRLDKISSTHFEVHDYKTSNRIMKQSQADMDRQLSLYALGIHQNFPEVEKIDLIWHFVKFDEEVTSARSQSQLEKMALETSSKIDMLESAIELGDLPTSKSILCDWCDYRKQCPEFAKIIKDSDIVETIDDFIKFNDSDIPEEDKNFILATLEDKIRLFSHQTGRKTLSGTNHKVVLETVFRRIPPDEGDLRWYGLQDSLKEFGISNVDLDKLFDSDLLDDNQRDSLKQYFDFRKTIEVIID